MAGFAEPPKKTRKPRQCWCHSGELYTECCKPYHEDFKSVPTAEKLLRARYSAFASKNLDFIMDTTHRSHKDWRDDRVAWAKSLRGLDKSRFTALRIDEQVALDDDTHEIAFEFDMRSVAHKGAIVVSEVSTFRRDDGVWYYAAGRDINAV